jgi:hypothetical protein
MSGLISNSISHCGSGSPEVALFANSLPCASAAEGKPAVIGVTAGNLAPFLYAGKMLAADHAAAILSLVSRARHVWLTLRCPS